MTQPAVSVNIEGGKWEPWEPLSCKVEKWLLFKDELPSKKLNDPPLKLTKYEIAEQVLHDIEDLGKNNTNDWFDEFPLFEEIQTLSPAEEIEINKENSERPELEFKEKHSYPNDGFALPEIHEPQLITQDLFSLSYENAATFILSSEDILCINNEPFSNYGPLQPACIKAVQHNKEEMPSKAEGEPDLSYVDSDTPDVEMEMTLVDEIIRSTSLGLDRWETDTSRSEESSGSISPKEEEMDDPDWKPNYDESGGQKYAKKSKLYRRHGNLDEKKLRKKEQNKNAAIRYRQRKKAEVCEILKEEKSLKEKKAKLEEKMANIQVEIKFLKALMRDLFKAKGILD